MVQVLPVLGPKVYDKRLPLHYLEPQGMGIMLTPILRLRCFGMGQEARGVLSPSRLSVSLPDCPHHRGPNHWVHVAIWYILGRTRSKLGPDSTHPGKSIYLGLKVVLLSLLLGLCVCVCRKGIWIF